MLRAAKEYENKGIMPNGNAYFDQPKLFWDIIKYKNFVEYAVTMRQNKNE